MEAANPYVAKRQPNQFWSLWEKRRPVLSQMTIELTERCNNNCIHCLINQPIDHEDSRQRELSTDILKAAIREAAALGCLTVKFTGGEPLLREDFEEIYLFARKLGLRVLIYTNATLISHRHIRLFQRYPPLEKIEITLYGMKPQSYEAVVRVKGAFAAAWQGVELLRRHNIPFIVKATWLPPNHEEKEELANWVSALSSMDGPPSYAMFFDLRSRRDSESQNQRIKRLRVSPEDGTRLLEQHPNYLSTSKQFFAKFTAPPGDRIFSCGFAKGIIALDAYGYLQGCLLLRHPETCYDFKQGSIQDALTNFFPEIRKKKATNPLYLNHCARCFLRSFCEQCPAKSWGEHGTLDTPVAYYCDIAHTQARHFGLLKHGEYAWKIKDYQDRINKFTSVSSQIS